MLPLRPPARSPASDEVLEPFRASSGWWRGGSTPTRRTSRELERFGTPRGLRCTFQPEVVQPDPFLVGCPRSLRGLEGTIAGRAGATLVHHGPLARYKWATVGQNANISAAQASRWRPPPPPSQHRW